MPEAWLPDRQDTPPSQKTQLSQDACLLQEDLSSFSPLPLPAFALWGISGFKGLSETGPPMGAFGSQAPATFAHMLEAALTCLFPGPSLWLEEQFRTGWMEWSCW